MNEPKPKPPDFPFDEVIAKAQLYCRLGHKVYQKFTCSGCGSRLTMEEPCVFHRTGSCDKCPAITDIEAQGCNYLLIMREGSKL